MDIDKKEQVTSVLDVRGLSISYADGFTLQPLSFAINSGETLAVVGESGSGKTTLARAVVNFFNCLDSNHPKKSGEVFIDGTEVLHKEEKDIREHRMIKFSVVYQNSSSLLNPSLTLSEQLWEILKKKYTKKESINISIGLMEQVGLCKDDLKLYPRQISGGMAQRFMIAMSISLKPKLVVLDEPTSSIDVDARDNFIRLIKNLQKETGISFLLITHDLLLAKELAVKMLVLYRGYTVEFGNADEIIENPTHPYTAGLIRASMDLNPLRDIWGIRSAKVLNSGCPFFGRCTQSLEKCSKKVPELRDISDNRKIRCHRGGIITVLEGRNVTKSFGSKSVLRNVDIKLHSGEVVAIVGKTGCGKTTLSSILSGFLESDKGEVFFQGKPADFKTIHKTVGGMQVIFQDSENALNPRLTVVEAVCEPLVLSGNKERMEEQFLKAMQDVGLYCGEDLAKRKIGNLSGGQKQRVNIARALIMQPNVIIADEPTSMLDASSKANLLRTLKGIQNSRGCALLIVTHDMVSARKISDKIYNLSSGTIENQLN